MTSPSAADRSSQNRFNSAFDRLFLLVLLGLTGFTITEPILSIFGKNPELFMFYNVESGALIGAYALVVALLPAGLLWLLSSVTHAVLPRAGQLVDYAILTLLAALWFLQLAKWTLGLESPAMLLGVALTGAVLMLVLYVRVSSVRSLLQIAAIGPVVSLSLFLFSSETGQLTHYREKVLLPTAESAKDTSVLFLILDEFPTMGLLNEEGGLDAERFPNLGRLSQEANWYRHFTVQAARTISSVPSFLTGNLPQAKRPTSKNFPNNIFTLLAPTHNLVAFEVVTGLCYLSKCTEGKPGTETMRPQAQFSMLLQKTGALWLQRISLTGARAGDMTDFQEAMVAAKVEPSAEKKESEKRPGFRALFPELGVQIAAVKPKRLDDFIQSLAATETATFYFLHLELPHLPWRFWDTGEMYDLPAQRAPVVPNNNDGGDWMTSVSEYRFLLQAKYTDRLLGEIMNRLKELNMWDDMLVVVTSDHGRSFKPGTNGRRINAVTLDSIAYAPLFIKQPKQSLGNVDDSNLMSMDILPTIATVLDIEIPWEIDGFPAGHSKVASRGDQKVYVPVAHGQVFGEKLGTPTTYSNQQHFPRYSSRQIGASIGPGADDNLLPLLNERLGLDRYLGRPVAEFESTTGGAAVIEQLEDLQIPDNGKAMLGAVVGNLEFKPSGNRILVAVNGHFVSASPLIRFKDIDHSFVAMLPPGVLLLNNEIELYLVDGTALIGIEKLTSAQR